MNKPVIERLTAVSAERRRSDVAFDTAVSQLSSLEKITILCQSEHEGPAHYKHRSYRTPATGHVRGKCTDPDTGKVYASVGDLILGRKPLNTIPEQSLEGGVCWCWVREPIQSTNTEFVEGKKHQPERRRDGGIEAREGDGK